MGEGEGSEGARGGITFTNKYRKTTMLKQLLLFVVVTILFAYACQPQNNENKYTLKEWDSIVKAKHLSELDSMSRLYKKSHPDAVVPDKNNELCSSLLLNKTFFPWYDSLLIEEWQVYHLCYPTHFLYFSNKNVKSIVTTYRENRIQPNNYFEKDFNILLSNLNLHYDADYRLFPFLDEVMLRYFKAEKLKISDTSKIKSDIEILSDYLIRENCENNTIENGQKIISILKNKNPQTLVYCNDILCYYIINYKHKNGKYSIEYEEVLPGCNISYVCF